MNLQNKQPKKRIKIDLVLLAFTDQMGLQT